MMMMIVLIRSWSTYALLDLLLHTYADEGLGLLSNATPPIARGAREKGENKIMPKIK